MGEMPTRNQEEIDQITKQRILSDANLIQGGADVKGGKLLPSEQQIETLHTGREREMHAKTPEGIAEKQADYFFFKRLWQ